MIALTAVLAVALAAEPHVLTLEVSGLRSAEGHLVVMVFAESAAEAYPTRYAAAQVTRTVPLSDTRASVAIEGLAPGRYAVRVHHDENGDGKLQKRLLVPREGLGFSAGARLSWNGPPSFSDAALRLTGDLHEAIVVRYP